MKNRSADSYRAVRLNAARGPRQSLLCKAERKRRGETRSQFDRRREEERRARLAERAA